jgi:hypothetical protein
MTCSRTEAKATLARCHSVATPTETLSAGKAKGAYLRAFQAMELGGLEPPTSWVR